MNSTILGKVRGSKILKLKIERDSKYTLSAYYLLLWIIF